MGFTNENDGTYLELERKIVSAKRDLKQDLNDFMDNLLNEKYLTNWHFENGNLACDLDENFKEYFDTLLMLLGEEDDLSEQCIEHFLSDCI